MSLIHESGGRVDNFYIGAGKADLTGGRNISLQEATFGKIGIRQH
jgi:hypothetical protein